MTELLVLSDPSGDFRPGDAYAESDVAFWLREGEIADGVRLARGDCECEVRDGRLVTLNGKRGDRPVTYQTRGTRLRMLRLLYERGLSGERPPTYREMQAELGLASGGAIAWHVQQLERDGYIIRDRYGWRGCWLTFEGIAKAEEATV